MIPPIIIRLAEPGEEALVYALMRAGFAFSAAYPNPSSALSETLESVRERLDGGAAILAFEHGRPAGSGRFRTSTKEGGYLSYERLAVLPALRHRGIGTAMVEFLEAHARSLGLSQVRADARSQQPDNRTFYLGLGYEVTGYAERYGIADMRTHMAKSL